MSKSLIINNKRYIPSAVIAREFDYTTDYVSRLAREEKVAATRIDRQWYISEESLRRFVDNAEVKKNERSGELRRQRQAERLIRQQKEKVVPAQQVSKSQLALAQAFAVVMCGSLLGFLGTTAFEENMSLADLAHGGQETVVHLVEAMIPDESPAALISDLSALASVFTAQETQEEAVVIEAVEQVAPPENTPQIPFSVFSDEVEVLYMEDGKGVVRPIFGGSDLDEVQEILQAPPHNDNNN